MKDRLRILRKYLGLTQGELGKNIGMSDVAISHMESGRTAISDQNAKLISLTFGCREKWLKEGTGDMMDDESLLSERELRLLDLFRKLSPRARELLIEYAEKLISDEEALRKSFAGEKGEN